jgi:hypothetical protein
VCCHPCGCQERQRLEGERKKAELARLEAERKVRKRGGRGEQRQRHGRPAGLMVDVVGAMTVHQRLA